MQGNYSQAEMISELRKRGENHSFAALGTGVVIVGPGAPFNVYPTWYAATDLEKAADAGVLEKRRLIKASSHNGLWSNFELVIYAVPSKR